MNRAFSAFVRAVIDGDLDATSRLLSANPDLATSRFAGGATRRNSTEFFYRDIAHYAYAGDTPLHLAAAAFRRSSAVFLVERGAALDAKNRRAAEPLHYAADANHWNPAAQSETIEYLLTAGANPNAADANGATPLHRAVRTLLAGGADVHATNKHGSTPYLLAVHDTGRGGAGSARSREQQRLIIALLVEAGGTPVVTSSTTSPGIARRRRSP